METGKVFEGKTTNEAIEKGLKELGIKRENAEIKILDNEDKRSFFSILAPRVVKVEITPKEEKRHERVKKDKEEIEKIDFKKATENVEKFLKEWIEVAKNNSISYTIKPDEEYLKVDINGEDLNYLIGHRGDVLNNLQIILSSIASKGLEYKVKVILNICGYKEKRAKALEPMTAYERKVIHSKLQDSKNVTTTSIGEEPYRRVVISLK
mgnify:CR=1 FL=1